MLPILILEKDQQKYYQICKFYQFFKEKVQDILNGRKFLHCLLALDRFNVEVGETVAGRNFFLHFN